MSIRYTTLSRQRTSISKIAINIASCLHSRSEHREHSLYLIAAIVLALAIGSWGLTWLESVKHEAYLDGVVYGIKMEKEEWTKKEKRWCEAAEAWRSLLEQCRRQELTQRLGEEALLELGRLLPGKGEGEDARWRWV